MERDKDACSFVTLNISLREREKKKEGGKKKEKSYPIKNSLLPFVTTAVTKPDVQLELGRKLNLLLR